MAIKVRKHSYVIPCSSDFRDAVQDLADSREGNVGDIARSVMLIVSHDIITVCPDPDFTIITLCDRKNDIVIKSDIFKVI